MILLPAREKYSRAERISDAVIHVTGLTAAAIAVPVLVILAAGRGDVPVIAGIAVYAACLIAMLVCSALYNMVPEGRWSAVLRGLDHSAIYFKIAGTYTPFTLLSGGSGAGLLAALWSAVVAGAGLRIFAPKRTRWICIALYICMGWAGVVVGRPMLAALSPGTLALIIVGGIIYTAGVAFYLLERLPFHNTIWHAFVLAGTCVLYAAITVQLLQPSALGPT